MSQSMLIHLATLERLLSSAEVYARACRSVSGHPELYDVLPEWQQLLRDIAKAHLAARAAIDDYGRRVAAAAGHVAAALGGAR